MEDNSVQRENPTDKPKMVTVITASFVSAENETEPTDEDWKMVLTANGYTEEKINEILG